MTFPRYVAIAMPLALTGLTNITGHTNVPILDMLKIVGLGALHLAGHKLFQSLSSSQNKNATQELKDTERFIAKKVTVNAYNIGLTWIDTPTINAIAACTGGFVPTFVVKAFFDATSAISIKCMDDENQAIRWGLMMSFAEGCIGVGVTYALSNVHNSRYVPEALGGSITQACILQFLIGSIKKAITACVAKGITESMKKDGEEPQRIPINATAKQDEQKEKTFKTVLYESALSGGLSSAAAFLVESCLLIPSGSTVPGLIAKVFAITMAEEAATQVQKIAENTPQALQLLTAQIQKVDWIPDFTLSFTNPFSH